ncbi:TPA: IbrB-like domain-containing protein [Vibrio parahaemolyticus]
MSYNVSHLMSVLESLDTESMSQLEQVSLFNLLSEFSAKVAPFKHPVLGVRLVRCESIINNDYNPNKVAPPEFKLLRHSILKDGLTMPVVTARLEGNSDLVIVDGYHRSLLIQHDRDIRGSFDGYIPVVILNKTLDERMSSSVRHNMARGAHQVELTAQLVMKLKNSDWTNEEIGLELGMDCDEVLRMQQVTGLAAAFKDNAFSMAWE